MVSVIMLSFIIEKNNIDIYIIIRTLWLIGSLTIYITLLLLIYNAEFNIFDSNVRLSILKRYFNDTLVSGTSRFFYGLIVLNIFSIGYTFGYLRKVKKYTRLVSSINIVIITILLVFANSRQNLLLLIFVIIVGKLMSYRLVSVIKVVFKISIVLGLLLFILSATTNIIPLIKEKYIERTTKQLKQGSERTETYKNAIDDMLSYPIFGVGLGNFQKNHGITTHNGYLWVGSELGIFPLLIYFIFILWVILTYNKVKYLKNDYQKIAKLLFVFIIGYLLISNNFNELFKDYIFYSVLILYLSLFNEVNISEEKKLINKHQKKIK
ncbi:hypothetical protein A5M85_07285 [Cellulophaga lytica]|uniref:O-antigen ligase family protein n=1 Tax=Cellulophaga lytica TaxID=979 RepID=UPI00095042D3|nr:O-antigen ligase family protein [Cellulophaga lytica]APU10092.1 hypothetical protein A5M85_07285 [Cellulophaga lytica]